LPGFFIAALAAVSTFERRTLDVIMPDPAPRLALRTRGEDETVELTMRMFLSHLFAYLTTYSFFLALLCVACEAIAPSIFLVIQNVGPDYHFLVMLVIKLTYVGAVSWILANIVTATLFGMYFIAERMHRPNA
jgi:hypothetical protein